ncbi:MAG TPA: zinc-binding dehydrogenase [Gemmatimonadales bacterium]|nr:zinc-binding dehydrogenase [Gemmatimonadales bacterium]
MMPPATAHAPSRSTVAMSAGVIESPGRAAALRVPQPEPGPGQVRVRVEGCGVCGSSLPVWEGRQWFEYPLGPGAPGHEGWGTIDAIGDAVEDWGVGDRVAFLGTNSFAEYDVADSHALARIPDALAGLAFPGEALACAVNAFRRSNIRAGETVAVVGVGFLGAVLVQLASRAGARVVAFSRRPFALEVARAMGAAEVGSAEDAARAVVHVRELTDGVGADCVIEVTGLQGPLDLATDLTRARGRLVIAGYHQDGLRTVNLQLWNWRGLDVINAHEREPRVYVDGIRAAADLVASGGLEPGSLYTHTLPLGRLGVALELLRTRPDGFLKALVVP